MPEYSSTTITPADGVKTPAMNGSTSGNYTLADLRAFILASKGLANGLASLDANGKLTSSQLPDLADDVLVYGSYALLPSPGIAGKLYITADDNQMYRWDDALTTPDYVVLSVDLSDYATKAEVEAADSDLKNALEDSEQRIENLEQAVSGSLVQTNVLTDPPSMANVRTITNANTILPWALLNRVGARAVSWNQLRYDDLATIKSINTSGTWNDNAYTWNGITFTVNNDHSVTVSGTASATTQLFVSPTIDGNGHKYVLLGCPSGGSITSYMFGSSVMGEYDTGSGKVFTQGGSSTRFGIRIYGGYSISGSLVFKPIASDLTAMNEASLTADQFRAKYPASYYPYNAGGIINLNPSGFLIRGKNLFDQEWELGSLDLSTGEEVPSSNVIRSSNFIRVEPSQTYFFKFPNQTSLLYFYDANKNFLSYYGGFNGNLSYQIPSNCYYLRFITASTTYNNDIQICLNSYSDKNTFHDYVGVTLDTSFTSDYKYVNENCHDYSENVLVDGQKMREEHRIVGSVDLGTLDWEHRTDVAESIFAASLSGRLISSLFQCVCARYPFGGNISSISYVVSKGDKVLTAHGYASSGVIYIYDTSYNDATAFKASLSGVTLNYELATPTTSLHNDPIPNFPSEDGTTITAITPQTDLVNAIDVPNTIAYMTKIGG